MGQGSWREKGLEMLDIANITRETECLRCGACCRVYPIGVSREDIERQKRLADYVIENHLVSDDKFVIVPESHGKKCPFLKANMKCEIYSTRPDVCRKLQPCLYRCKMSNLHVAGIDIRQARADAKKTGVTDSLFVEWVMSIDLKTLVS